MPDSVRLSLTARRRGRAGPSSTSADYHRVRALVPEARLDPRVTPPARCTQLAKELTEESKTVHRALPKKTPLVRGGGSRDGMDMYCRQARRCAPPSDNGMRSPAHLTRQSTVKPLRIHNRDAYAEVLDVPCASGCARDVSCPPASRRCCDGPQRPWPTLASGPRGQGQLQNAREACARPRNLIPQGQLLSIPRRRF